MKFVARIFGAAVACIAAAASAPALAQPAPVAAAGDPPPTLESILPGPEVAAEEKGIPAVRFSALRDTALAYGAQAGLARRTWEIRARLERAAPELDETYNFQSLMIGKNVLPPVLTEAREVFDQQADDLLRLVGAVYRIESQARFTYAPPTWRTYLSRNFRFDAKAVAAVKPQNDDEAKVWKRFVEQGFKSGVEQADRMLKEDLARLNRDFRGMALYRTLLAENKVTAPFVAEAKTGVTGSGDTMNVAEIVLRISATPQFVRDVGEWNRKLDDETARMLPPRQRAADAANADKPAGAR